MFSRPSVTEKLAHGKNLSPKLAKPPRKAKPQVADVIVGLTVEMPWISAMLCVTLLCVIVSTSAQTTRNAVAPTPPMFGLPARLGKLLQRKDEPPPLRKHDPGKGFPIASTPVIVTSGPGQGAPPSVEC